MTENEFETLLQDIKDEHQKEGNYYSFITIADDPETFPWKGKLHYKDDEFYYFNLIRYNKDKTRYLADKKTLVRKDKVAMITEITEKEALRDY